MGCLMYYKENADQLGIDEFFLPFGGKLKKDNRSFPSAFRQKPLHRKKRNHSRNVLSGNIFKRAITLQSGVSSL